MPNIRYAIMCDDIRQENNGKFILIGVYADQAFVHGFPAQQNISCLIALDDVVIHEKYRVILSLVSGAQLGVGEVEVKPEADPSRMVLIALPPIPISLSAPDTLVFSVGFSDGTLREAARLDFTVAPSKTNNEQPRL